MDPSLTVLAAGLGSRYGSLKQTDQFGPNGESIVEYSIYDALKVGFKKFVFVIREDISNDFQEYFRYNLKDKAEVSFVTQKINELPFGFNAPKDRQKPWGTAQAVLSAESKINEPFAIINADDFYGRSSFQMVFNHLEQVDPRSLSACLVGFVLKNTLSDYGEVSRGICKTDNDGFLEEIIERTQISRIGDKIYYSENAGDIVSLSGNEITSMNLMGFTPGIFSLIKDEFVHFLNVSIGLPNAEFYIPAILNKAREDGVKIPVLSSGEQWFGVTYKEDKAAVMEKLYKLIESGVYPENLW